MKLVISNLSKTYSNGVRALSGINLEISPGMFGLLGPNGAGKSTLMRIIGTLQEPDCGEIRWNGTDLLQEKQKIRRILGYLPQSFGVYPGVTAETLLDHFALLHGIIGRRDRKKTVEGVLALTNLTRHRRKKLGGFSGGMKQRFGIAQALLGRPDLLIVDEPTAGLDPGERVRFHNILSEIGEHTVVILSTHIVADVSDLCMNMAVIHQGKLLHQGSPAQAVTALRGKIWRTTISRDTLPEYEGRYRVISSKLHAGRTRIHVFANENPENGFEPVGPDLNDVYFTLIGGREKAVAA